MRNELFTDTDLNRAMDFFLDDDYMSAGEADDDEDDEEEDKIEGK